MAVWSAAEKDQVEYRQTDRILSGERCHEGFLIVIGKLLRVVEVFYLNRVDGRGARRGGNVVEEVGFEKGIVAVSVVERDSALVGEEDLPFGEVDVIGRVGRLGQESFRECRRQRAARNGDAENGVLSEGGALSSEDVCTQLWREGVGRGEGVEIRLFRHGGLWVGWRVDRTWLVACLLLWEHGLLCWSEGHKSQ